MANKRLFLAIPISVDVQDYLRETIDDFIPDINIKWTPEEHRHITVFFLGDVPEEQVSVITAQLSPLCQTVVPFRLRLSEMHTIYRGKFPSMIWTIFQESKPFEHLVHNVCKALSLTPDRKPYAHITLARIKEARSYPADLPDHEALTNLPMVVRGIELWESDLQPTGAVYTHLAAFPFKTLDDDDLIQE